MPEIIFSKKKKTLQIWDFESFVFWSKFPFLGTVLGRFGQHFYSPPILKKAFYGPVLEGYVN